MGQALKRNKNAPLIPCHRVLRGDRHLGGYAGSNPINIARKRRLLEKEGLSFTRDEVLSKELWSMKMHRFTLVVKNQEELSSASRSKSSIFCE